ncbi:MAG: PQQ-dependent sugar dehydrogenase [Hyphomonas sp.]
MTDPASSAASGNILNRTARKAAAWLAALPLWAKLGLGAAAAAGFTGFVLFLGFMVNQHQVFPAKLFARVDGKLQQFLPARAAPVPALSGTFRSTLLDLDLQSASVNTGRDTTDPNLLNESGGGLTSFGDDVLLLAYDGRIYAGSSPETVRQTAVSGPDNNRAAYIEYASRPELEDTYFFRLGYLRYNDLLHFSNAEGQGLIASYTEYHPDRTCYTNTLARLDIDPAITSIDAVSAAPSDWTVVYRTEPCLPFKPRHYAMEGQMASGKLAFEAPSTVYLTSGDFHWDGMRSDGELIAQNPEAQYGKVLRVNIDTGAGEIVSMGHRNMQGITFASDGRLFVTEHGPNGGDELNVIEQGGNYGWPLTSLGISYSGAPLPDAEDYGLHDGFVLPVFAWMPSIAISALIEVQGFHESWDGDLLAGSLSDQSLHRVRFEQGKPVYSERIEIGARIRDLHQHTDGRLVIWTDELRLAFISPKPRVDHNARLDKHVSDWHLPPARAIRLRETLDGCAECHAFAVGDNTKAPSLARAARSKIASTDFEGYSDALKGKGGKWDHEALAAYLRDPQAFAPGTSMPDQQLTDPATLKDVVDFLESIESDF